MAENERLALVVKELKEKRLIFNNADLASVLEVSPTYVSLLINGKKPLTGKMVNNMVTRFPDINPAWLMTGEGSMLKTRLYESDEQEKVLTSEWYKGLLDEYNNVKEENKQLREENETLKNKEAELMGMLKNALAVKAAEIKKQ